ncbi:MAG: GNAT family N-acetyltransferase [Nitrosopumilaceae archaeon]|nr:GNAT family N-acetyltransferase [Nitrosopumilaceae archaeon]
MTGNVKIVKAELNDAEEMAKLESLCFDLDNTDIDEMYMIEWKISIGMQNTYKAVLDGTIIGGSVSFPTAKKTWYMDSLFVHPDHQKRGIGRRLRKTAIENAWLRPIITLVNVKKPHLLKFYKSMGFQIREEIDNYFDNGESHYVMALD